VEETPCNEREIRLDDVDRRHRGRGAAARSRLVSSAWQLCQEPADGGDHGGRHGPGWRGRAKLLFSSVELGPVVEVSCKGDKRTLELFQDRVSDAVCGIRLSKPEVVEGVGGSLRLRVQVEWDERG
jgi:hypothetical protein